MPAVLRSRALAPLLLCLLLVAGAAVAGLSRQAGTDIPVRLAAASTGAQVWLTTADGTQQLASKPAASFGAAKKATNLTVYPTALAQRFSGAGASITESSAGLLNGLSSTARTTVMSSLFSSTGLRLSYLRQPLGASDFVSRLPFYSYSDTPGSFDASRDAADILPLLQQARQLNPGLKIMGTPWTAPAWMKTTASLNGGSLLPTAVSQYADYLVQVAQAYASAGVPLADMTIGNEPGFSGAYPSMQLSTDQQAAVLRAVDQKLTAAGISTHLWAYDHNWDGASDALTVLRKVADVARVQGAAFHCYGGSPEAVASIVSAGWRVYDTECSPTVSSVASRTFADTLRWQTDNLVVRAFRSGAETLMLWNLALDANGGPQFGNCGSSCRGVVQVAGGVVTHGAPYAVLGHVSKFVQVGARVASSTSGTNGIEDVVFVNPDGSRVMVALNTGSASTAFSVTDGARTFAYTLAAGSVATFVWN